MFNITTPYKDLSPSHQTELLQVLKNKPWILNDASETLKNDRDFFLAAVQQNGLFLGFASDELRADIGVVLVAVQRNGLALEYASDRLRVDREVVLAAVQQDGMALRYASDELRADRNFIIAAVQQNGGALRHTNATLRADKKVVLAAVAQDGFALAFASAELRADKKVVLTAVGNSGQAFCCASKELKNDRDFVLEAVQQNGLALEFASAELRADREVVFAAARNNEAALEFVSDELRADYLQTQSAYRAFFPGVFVQREPNARVSCLPSVLVREVHGYLGVRLLPLRDQSTAQSSSQSQSQSQSHGAGSLAQPCDPRVAAEEVVLAAEEQDSSVLENASIPLQNDGQVVGAATPDAIVQDTTTKKPEERFTHRTISYSIGAVIVIAGAAIAIYFGAPILALYITAACSTMLALAGICNEVNHIQTSNLKARDLIDAGRLSSQLHNDRSITQPRDPLAAAEEGSVDAAAMNKYK